VNPLAAEVAPVQRSNPFFTAENLLSVAALSLMALLPVSDMVARATGVNGITGGAVIVQQLTLWIGFLGAALAARSGNLLSLSASTFLPDKLRAPARIVAFGVLAAVALCLVWASLQFVQVEKQSGSWLLQDVLPKWVALVIMPVGFARFGWPARSGPVARYPGSGFCCPWPFTTPELPRPPASLAWECW